MSKSKHIGHSRLFILFHSFIALPLSAVSRGKEAEYLILWECSALFSWEMSEAAADLNERSSSLEIHYAVINLGFCWWAADGPLMSLYCSSTQRYCISSLSLPGPSSSLSPPCWPRLRIWSCEGKNSPQNSMTRLSLKKWAVPVFIMQPAASLLLRLIFLFTGIFTLNIWFPESPSYTTCHCCAIWGLLSICFI